jgi:hypothetical protein
VLVQDEPDESTFVPQMPWIRKERFRTAVNAYKKGKATGTDEFSAECLQSMDDLTVEHILNIFNASLALKYVPKQWRDMNVLFIPKPGKNDYTYRRAFRPVSLMSLLFKTLERLVLWYIEETSLNRHPMHGSQYGF